MGKKQTAVQWLVEQIEEKGDSWENASIGRIKISIKVEDYLNLIEQAKAMEKEQIVNTFKDAQVLKVMNDETRAEQYYNKIYKE